MEVLQGGRLEHNSRQCGDDYAASSSGPAGRHLQPAERASLRQGRPAAECRGMLEIAQFEKEDGPAATIARIRRMLPTAKQRLAAMSAQATR